MTGSFGELLKREREMREISLNEVTLATRIAPRFLQALENEDWEKLPGGAFNRGFVRAIARYLGLKEEALLAEYDLAHIRYEPAPRNRRENRIPSGHRLLVLIVALVILGGIGTAVVFSFHGWRRFSGEQTSGQSPAHLAPAAQAQPTSTLPNLLVDPITSASALDLSISTSAPTRIRIVADGKEILDAHLSAGETRHFFAGRQFEVSAANSSAVLLELNGHAMPAFGAPGASGTIMLSQKSLRASSLGNSQP